MCTNEYSLEGIEWYDEIMLRNCNVKEEDLKRILEKREGER